MGLKTAEIGTPTTYGGSESKYEVRLGFWVFGEHKIINGIFKVKRNITERRACTLGHQWA